MQIGPIVNLRLRAPIHPDGNANRGQSGNRNHRVAFDWIRDWRRQIRDTIVVKSRRLLYISSMVRDGEIAGKFTELLQSIVA